MAAPLPSTEPTAFVAGDTIQWTKSLSDFPANDGWSLSYALRLEQGAGVLNLIASASGSDFLTTISGASSSVMTPGLWRWASYATKAGERTSVGHGSVTVQPNLATIDFSTDLRSPAKLAYDNALKAWATFQAAKSVSLNGRIYTARDSVDLILYVNQCKSDYLAELQAEQFEITGINTRRIPIGLNRV